MPQAFTQVTPVLALIGFPGHPTLILPPTLCAPQAPRTLKFCWLDLARSDPQGCPAARPTNHPAPFAHYSNRSKS